MGDATVRGSPRDDPAPTVWRTLLDLVTWPLTVLVIGIIIVRVQDGVWYSPTVTVMTVSACVVSAVIAGYRLRTGRARAE